MKNLNNKKEEKSYTANEVVDIVERFDKSLKAIAENTDRKIGELGAVIERVDEKIATLAESMDIKFEGVYKRLDGIDARLDTMDTKIDRLQDDMVEIKYELKNKVGRDEFERLEKRVIKLEKVSFSH